MIAIGLTGGEAHGAWFEGHKLDGAPETVRVAVGGADGPALLDLPDDELEPGERLVVYRRRSVGHMCGRGRGGRCSQFATYEPAEGLPHLASADGRRHMRQLAVDAGLAPQLRLV